MIQDIAPAVFHNEFHPRPPKGKDILLDFKGHEIALKKDGGFFTWPLAGVTDPLWLFDIDDTGIFLSDLSSFAPDYRRIFEMRYVRPLKDAFLAVTAWHLSSWYNNNRFCGSDGTRLVPSKTERALQCPHCGRIIYPRINPAVIVAIINDEDEILVTRYANGPYRRDALVAGYCEIGETLEDTVHREVKEETGLDVDELHYYKSQPWGLSGSLLAGFWCRTHGHREIRLQRDELDRAVWRRRTDTFNLNDNPSLTAEMIHVFQEGGYR